MCSALRPTDSFQSTHPVRGGTENWQREHYECKGFQSTHPVRGGTYRNSSISKNTYISIHPPREGWDNSIANAPVCRLDFNPPTP